MSQDGAGHPLVSAPAATGSARHNGSWATRPDEAGGPSLPPSPSAGWQTMNPQLVLCTGMHRSGTSLTASLLQGLGVELPGDLIAADASNPTGYFENRTVVDHQERLLQDLGYWWPTERASHGLPVSLQRSSVYRAHVEWLTSYLETLCSHREATLAIKDPRSSLLLPAWRESCRRLGLHLRVVICLRDPRDVCWSLVWRDGPIVGMDWSRAQRLWLGHYRAMLRHLGDLPACVARYEAWLHPHEAQRQLSRLSAFLGLQPGAEQFRASLARIRPEFNHGGQSQLPAVDPGLRALHVLLAFATPPARVGFAQASLATLTLNTRHVARKAWTNLQLLGLRTPWVRWRLGAALDPACLESQLGSPSLRLFRRRFTSHPDLRPHPLISPAYLNRERERLGLPRLRHADDLFRHLLDPDLLPLDPHPWFACRQYQRRCGTLGAGGAHPILGYLNRAADRRINPYPHPQWLSSLGCAAPCDRLQPMPEPVQALYPPLFRSAESAAPSWVTSPSWEGDRRPLGWREIGERFFDWPEDDVNLPLRWLLHCPDVKPWGGDSADEGALAAKGLGCWWLQCDWVAPLLSRLVGAEQQRSRALPDPQTLLSDLRSRGPDQPPLLLALSEPVLDQLLERGASLPAGTALLNLAWPRPHHQAGWLRLLAGASLILDCRPTLRAYLRGFGLQAVWPAVPVQDSSSGRPPGNSRLLMLAAGSSEARQLRTGALARLRDSGYGEPILLDSRLQALADAPAAAAEWLERLAGSQACWMWLDAPPAPDDARALALLAWCEWARIPIVTAGSPEEDALLMSCRS